jgi:hypothetical protein
MADSIRGINFPTQCDVLFIARDITQRRKDDPNFASLYDEDKQVRDVLGRYGLAEDVQTEWLNNDNRVAAAAGCMLTCWHTCWFSDCVCTSCCITQNA